MVDLNLLYEAILGGKLEQSVEVTNQAIAEGVEPQAIINGYMIKAMEEVGQRFQRGEAFVPNLLMAARAMKGSLDILKPLMKGDASTSLGKVVIGTVKGDLHDIGKNLVASMLEGCGFEVINLGVDVGSEKFIEAVKENKADILCLSALLTTTMGVMADVVKAAESAGIRDKVKIMVGGAPLNQEFCDSIGADCYTEDATARMRVKQLPWLVNWFPLNGFYSGKEWKVVRFLLPHWGLLLPMYLRRWGTGKIGPMRKRNG